MYPFLSGSLSRPHRSDLTKADLRTDIHFTYEPLLPLPPSPPSPHPLPHTPLSPSSPFDRPALSVGLLPSFSSSFLRRIRADIILSRSSCPQERGLDSTKRAQRPVIPADSAVSFLLPSTAAASAAATAAAEAREADRRVSSLAHRERSLARSLAHR